MGTPPAGPEQELKSLLRSSSLESQGAFDGCEVPFVDAVGEPAAAVTAEPVGATAASHDGTAIAAATAHARPGSRNSETS
eukprot:NODE_9788_length_328_cov_151.659341.p1 GENE.NODE_9788_length_328_cov_151.659341~~NODE_9788_length_328_cov_151.659341.p1  ORF type:complete len:80 (+),score=18.35 NODE_9788_length_328_cov_151.659341:3-242(+)